MQKTVGGHGAFFGDSACWAGGLFDDDDAQDACLMEWEGEQANSKEIKSRGEIV